MRPSPSPHHPRTFPDKDELAGTARIFKRRQRRRPNMDSATRFASSANHAGWRRSPACRQPREGLLAIGWRFESRMTLGAERSLLPCAPRKSSPQPASWRPVFAPPGPFGNRRAICPAPCPSRCPWSLRCARSTCRSLPRQPVTNPRRAISRPPRERRRSLPEFRAIRRSSNLLRRLSCPFRFMRMWNRPPRRSRGWMIGHLPLAVRASGVRASELMCSATATRSKSWQSGFWEVACGPRKSTTRIDRS